MSAQSVIFIFSMQFLYTSLVVKYVFPLPTTRITGTFNGAHCCAAFDLILQRKQLKRMLTYCHQDLEE